MQSLLSQILNCFVVLSQKFLCFVLTFNIRCRIYRVWERSYYLHFVLVVTLIILYVCMYTRKSFNKNISAFGLQNNLYEFKTSTH